MAGIRRSAFTLFKSFAAAPPKQNLPRFGFVACAMAVRSLSTIEVTKNITLISNDKKTGKIVDLKLEVPEKKPLVVMLSWLMARKKHIIKYADLYLNRGYDVMNISISPWQLLWPVKGTQVVAADLLKFLEANSGYGPTVIHGFSVGGYLWSEAMVQMNVEQERYQHIVDKFIGQIWDSTADVTEIPEGLPVAVFPRNKVMQSALKQYIIYHLKTFDKVATRHYVRASQIFHTNVVKAPALFFISKSDSIGAEKSNLRARDNWNSNGIETHWKVWESTPHVGHFRHYPEEYKAELKAFLDKVEKQSVNKQASQIVKAVRAKN